MQITQPNLNALRVTFNRVFQSAYQVAENWYGNVSTTMPSASKLNTYGWMNNLPQMREWIGERIIHNISENVYILFNKKFELTYGVSRTEIEDDSNTLGIYNSQFEDLGKNAKKHPDQLVALALANGQNSPCFDGQPFFGVAHPVNQYDPSLGTYSNYSANGMPLTAPNYEAVRAIIMGYKNSGGIPLGLRPTTLLVPPTLEVQAKRIVESTMVATAAGTAPEDNMLRGTAKVLVAEELAAYPTTWYLMVTDRSVKPLVYQLRKPAEFQMLVNLTDPNVFELDEFRFGAYIRDNAGYTLPFLAYKASA